MYYIKYQTVVGFVSKDVSYTSAVVAVRLETIQLKHALCNILIVFYITMLVYVNGCTMTTIVPIEERKRICIASVHILRKSNYTNKTSTIRCIYVPFFSFALYSKTPLLRSPLCLRKKGLYSGVVLLLR